MGDTEWASLSNAVHLDLARWNNGAVEPTHVVMAWDVAERLAAESGEWRIGHGLWRVWGVPVIVADLPLGTWGLGTTRPVDAERMRGARPEPVDAVARLTALGFDRRDYARREQPR